MKSTKKALILSVISLLACVSMLIGSTFAWFTDSVTSANNIIKSGNLDIVLEYATFNEDGTFKAWKDVSGASDILTNELFEPGAVEVAYLRLKNAGSLALKYQLGINIVSEVPGVNVAGQSFKLSDYIMFYADEGVNGETAPYADRNAAIAASVDSTPISAGYTKAHYMTPGQELYVALVVGMHPSVGNEANHDGYNVPEIDLGINVYATQVDYEDDSFDQYYDGGAKWLGGVSTNAWYDASATEYTIGSAEQLAGLAKLVNEGNSFANKTIKLISNIDLNNLPWTPIGLDLSNCFSGTFDGNGYTISNLNVEGVNNVGLFGYAALGGNVKNLTVKDATAKGNDYVGVIMGRGYTDIVNCHVENATVIATPYLKNGIYDGGAKAGGIIGQILEGEGNTVIDCSVNNVNVSGFRDIGGVVGMVHNHNYCAGNTASNVTLAYVLCPEITADRNENAGAIYGRVQASATVSPAKDSAENQNFTFLGFAVSTAADLKAALAQQAPIITLADDLGITETIDVRYDVTINGGGNTISRAAGFTGTIFNVASGKTLTTSDVVIDGGAVWAGRTTYGANTANSGVVATGNLIATNGNAKLVLNAGTILQNNDGANAINLATRGGGSLTLNGAWVINNRSAAGAIWGGDDITINEGSKINGNHATSIGGAIRMVNGYNAIVFTMNGGEINYNTSDGTGGAIWGGNNASYYFNGGEMAYNSAASAGGAIWTGTYEKYYISGDFKLHDNVGGELAGAIRFCNYSSLTMTGGSVYNNTVNGVSNAFYLNNNSASITGGSIADNFSYSGGLGLTIGDADITGVISYGLSTNHNTAYLAADFDTIQFTVNPSASNFSQFNFKPAADYVYTAGDEAKLVCLTEGYATYWDAATGTFRLQAI